MDKLVLTGCLDEPVRLYTVGGTIQVLFNGCNDLQAHFGFAAPPRATILRAEIDNAERVIESNR